jgi:hypothetical protein
VISFASLFVGLVLGIVDVQLLAGEGVDRVGLFLDGRPVAELREPFETSLDLGCEPAPHELVAVAYDAHGTELDRARQWINRPRPAAEASLVLEEGRGGHGRFARLTWRALVGEVPDSVTVSLDGAPVPVSDPSRIELPPFEPTRVHVLRVVLDFGEGVSASTELVFGGSAKAGAQTELTAVAVALEKGATLPGPGDLAGWFEADGSLLEVAAVEAGGADVVFVAEGSAGQELRRGLEAYTYSRRRQPIVRQPLARGDPDEDLRLCFLWPVARTTPQAGMVANVYPMTRWFSRGRLNVDRIAAERLEWPPWERQIQRIADAVAVAGLTAARDGRRRAVVLLLGPGAKDGSRLSPDEAERFVARLGVPLHVWSIGGRRSPEAARWGHGKTTLVDRGIGLELEKLLENLERQRVVWVEGAHLPQEVSLTPLAKGARLVR